jgi:hypothetical protein
MLLSIHYHLLFSTHKPVDDSQLKKKKQTSDFQTVFIVQGISLRLNLFLIIRVLNNAI